MNLHIVPDSKFINTFYTNLRELGLLHNNTIIVRSAKKLQYIEHDIPAAPLYTSSFDQLVGDTLQYDAVYIHLFSPLMYRWVARRSFRKLNWMVWGADLYNLPFIDAEFYEPLTRQKYSTKQRSIPEWLYLLKVWTTNMPWKRMAYSKIDNILTWMTSEYNFARATIPALRAEHVFFFYENQLPYQKLDEVVVQHQRNRSVPAVMVGNSGYPTNNHLDAVAYLQAKQIKADLYIPVSYGDKKYVDLLKKNLAGYANGRIEFIDRYMSFDEYLNFLSGMDVLLLNTIRPQGYGNIFMMLYLGKAVFLNEKNISLKDLAENDFRMPGWDKIQLVLSGQEQHQNRDAVVKLLSHERLLTVYRQLFG